MKEEIPNYNKNGLDNVVLKPKDKTILKDFIILVSGSACQSRVNNIRRIMLMIYDVSEISFDKWDLDNLRKFMSVLNNSDKPNSSTNDIKKTLKRFLREHYSDWFERFKGFKDTGLKQKKELNEEKINKSILIKPDELDLLLKDKRCSFLYQCYISCAYETACRPSELLNTKFKDWDLEDKKVKIFSTKNNKIRILPIKDCIYYIKQHKQNYPFANVTDEDYLFPSSRNRNKILTLSAILNFFKRITLAKLGRGLKPYILRHTRLSFLHKKLSPKSYEMFADHSYQVAVATYTHLDDEDLREEMFDKVFKKRELTKEEKTKLELEIEELKKNSVSKKDVMEMVKNALTKTSKEMG